MRGSTHTTADSRPPTRTLGHWIDGKPAESTSGRHGQVFNPATGAADTRVALASVEEVDSAVAAAKAAHATWRTSSLAARTAILFRYRALLDAHRDEIAALITAEHGKVHADALGEVARGLEIVELACAIPEKLKGELSTQVSTRVDVASVRQPLGVVAGITPFNFPAMVPMWMFPVAIACGNTFVLKPSEKDPSAALRLAELASEAGLPNGVLNVVQGDKVAVDRLLEHPDVAAVSFVGSTPIARYVQLKAVEHGKRVQALGGAKNHMLVLPDADLDFAADQAVNAAYGSAGERCMAVSVVVAVGDTGDDLVRRIADRARALRIGPGDDPASEMGPLITREHRDKVASYVAGARAQGAEVVVDGTGFRPPAGHEDGFFLGVSLLDHVPVTADAYRDEIFGPVLCVVRAETYEEAVELINSSRWGNGTAIFTRDGGAARRFQLEVEAGMVGVNVPIPVPVGHHSFGGWKESLFGDLHVYGSDGVAFYTRGKVITTRWPDPADAGINLGFPSHS
ncbi:CoA-acylating methylmalonate-semialdehyde dehydrogenase [Streptomyces durbertensis]|uniref:methylmalonate-semialdehyde dehydrogenase (CoA acylating) n=1 Tax=Streptomyces durbertensis TaxID=2448886 RepID=A0ABR6EJM3_9ACTN|nr:CoA-acylating methylmalonate-semialdehyde dehydrogenase [Streptomyces durbertensis]MBB1245523.1 CoA-acylating methylmalonate-semialdehyde dehydrogenase [Streptomyces durbertensis]